MTAAAPVLVLYGGDDAEAPISRQSGPAVATALREADRWPVVTADLPTCTAAAVHAALAESRPRAVLPILHGPWGEGGPLQQVLADAGVPFVGTPAASAALAMDKQRTKDRAAAAGVAVIPGAVVGHGERPPLRPPAVLKPVDDGSSVDLVMADDDATLARAIDDIAGRRGRVLVEERIVGREVTVAMLLGTALPLVEIRPADQVYDFAAKYERDDTVYVVDPDLSPDTAAACREAARIGWHCLGLRDLARFDFMIPADGRPRLLEANTMPGFTATSLFPRAAAASGQSFADVVASLVDAAIARGPDGRDGRSGPGAPGGPGALGVPGAPGDAERPADRDPAVPLGRGTA